MARKKLLRRRRADQDVDEQVGYYLDEGATDTALRFIDAVDAACRRLQDHPEIGVLREFQSTRLTGLRIWFLPDFPEHLVFYQQTEKTVEVVRILHAKRDVGTVINEQDE